MDIICQIFTRYLRFSKYFSHTLFSFFELFFFIWTLKIFSYIVKPIPRIYHVLLHNCRYNWFCRHPFKFRWLLSIKLMFFVCIIIIGLFQFLYLIMKNKSIIVSAGQWLINNNTLNVLYHSNRFFGFLYWSSRKKLYFLY